MIADAFLAGGSGLVGSHILTTLAKNSSIRRIGAVGRRDLTPPILGRTGTAFVSWVDSDTSKWPGLLSGELAKSKDANVVYFSAMGTTRKAAGGLDNQRKIDHDIPVSLAEAVAAHVPDTPDARSVLVLISSAGASIDSMMAYSKMKGETEEAVKGMLKPEGATGGPGLDHVVILRPGLLVGKRREEDSRPTEYALRKTAAFFGSVLGAWAKDFWAQDVDIIAKAAVSAGLQCANGEVKERVWIVGQSDIVRLGRTG